MAAAEAEVARAHRWPGITFKTMLKGNVTVQYPHEGRTRCRGHGA